MYRTVLCVFCVLFASSECFGQGCGGQSLQSSCAGDLGFRPIRAILAARPIRTGILARISSAQASCSGRATVRSSCAGKSLATPSCAGSTQLSATSTLSSPEKAAPQAACSCGCQTGAACTCLSSSKDYNLFQTQGLVQQTTSQVQYVSVQDCPTGTCGLVESHQAFATPVRSFVSNGYQAALASAQFRAANRIHHHSYLDTGSNVRGGSGVGWASHDATPTTCLGRGGSAYAVVQGQDGWYATKFQ